MLAIHLCDDQKEHLQRLSKIIQNIITFEGLDMKLASAVGKPGELLEAIKISSKPGLYFLDIELKAEMNGMELATEIRKIDPRGFIVFVTTHDEMAPLTFRYKVEAMDYIIKENVDEISKKIRECMRYALKQYALPTNPMHRTIAIQVEDKVIMISQEDIVLVESSLQAHKITIYTEDSAIDITSTIRAIKEQLEENFFQCNKSCLVNIKRIARMEKKRRMLLMDNGKECTISVRQMKSLEELLKKSV